MNQWNVENYQDPNSGFLFLNHWMTGYNKSTGKYT